MGCTAHFDEAVFTAGLHWNQDNGWILGLGRSDLVSNTLRRNSCTQEDSTGFFDFLDDPYMACSAKIPHILTVTLRFHLKIVFVS